MKTLIGVYFIVLALAILSLHSNEDRKDLSWDKQPGTTDKEPQLMEDLLLDDSQLGKPQLERASSLLSFGRRAHQADLPLVAFARE